MIYITDCDDEKVCDVLYFCYIIIRHTLYSNTNSDSVFTKNTVTPLAAQFLWLYSYVANYKLIVQNTSGATHLQSSFWLLIQHSINVVLFTLQLWDVKVLICDLTPSQFQAEVKHKDDKVAQTCCCFKSHYQAHVVIFACSLSVVWSHCCCHIVYSV